MICRTCGQATDTIDEDTQWSRVSDPSVNVTLPLYRCGGCGNQQRF